MVDSGSDVVTLREEVLESLDLELLGTVRSKGVHASREKRLYKAQLLIGSTQIEIEVNILLSPLLLDCVALLIYTSI